MKHVVNFFNIILYLFFSLGLVNLFHFRNAEKRSLCILFDACLLIIIKYLDIARETVDMWDMESAVIVPIVVTINNLIIAESLDQHLVNLALGGWGKQKEGADAEDSVPRHGR